MDAFLQIFGDITVDSIVLITTALIFLWKIYVIVKEHLISKYKQEEEKEQKLQEVIEQATLYPKWHEQSISIQKKFSATISSIETAQRNNLECLNRLTKLIAENKATTCRYRILRFNDEILHDLRHSKEHFDQVLEDITRYETYCHEHPEYKNNKAVLAIENIKRVYQKCSNDNTFL